MWATSPRTWPSCSRSIQRRLADDPNDVHARARCRHRAAGGATTDARCWHLLRLDPGHDESIPRWLAAHAHSLLGEIDEATTALEGALERRPDEPALLALLALADALDGDPTSARAIAEQSKRSTGAEAHPHHAFHHLALTYSVLGDVQEALAWLKRAADEGFPCLPWFETDPFLSNLRGSEQGAQYLRDLGRRHAFFRREFGVVAWMNR